MERIEGIISQMESFRPQDEEAAKTKAQVLSLCREKGEAILYREAPCHVTASALVCNRDLDRVLLVHHNLFGTYTWPGGHVDGGDDFLAEAIREIQEETGVETVTPLTGEILSLDLLPVPEQTKQGKTVASHLHCSVGFGCIVSETEALSVREDENSDVRWVPVEELEQYSGEKHMMVIYLRILERMKEIQKEKKERFLKLPERLLPWYSQNARDLPWRQDREPYHVWLSEIMLQQTRVEAVKEYYRRFLSSLPTLEDLANCEEQALLKLWEGLGYYNRARNLQKAAVVLLEQYGGAFPRTYEELLQLPGIGAYTAGAIASICFEQPTPAVDGNVLRVVSRVTEDFTSIDLPKQKQQVTTALSSVYPAGHCGDFTQSLMELGATVCVPNGAPKCGECPLNDLCLSRHSGTSQRLPMKKKKAPRRLEEKTVFVLRCGNEVAVECRSEKGVLHGLWQFPNVSGQYSENEIISILEQMDLADVTLERKAERTHIFTHIQWNMTCYYLACTKGSSHFHWATADTLTASIPLPSAFRQFWDETAQTSLQ